MNVLLLGGTGAMGLHLASALVASGDEVIVTSRCARLSKNPALRYIQGNAKDLRFVASCLEGQPFDAIVDFMVRGTEEFRCMVPMLETQRALYVFVSSYRVYADTDIIREDSPRLLDVCEDESYLKSDEYALAKARCEDLLRKSGVRSWLIVRPGVTYDGSGRFQFGCLESSSWLWRAIHGLSAIATEEMLDRQTTISWGGDIATMIARLIRNPESYCSEYTLASSEHMSWREVLACYRSVLPVDVKLVSLAAYLRATRAVYQMKYDRMYNRVIDNTKVLQAIGLRQSDFLHSGTGLSDQLSLYLTEGGLPQPSIGINARLDATVGECSLPLLVKTGKPLTVAAKYAFGLGKMVTAPSW